MIILGNIIWMLFGGIFTALYWLLAGCLFCITIIGIPFGLQAFKIAKLSLLPFGARVVERPHASDAASRRPHPTLPPRCGIERVGKTSMLHAPSRRAFRRAAVQCGSRVNPPPSRPALAGAPGR